MLRREFLQGTIGAAGLLAFRRQVSPTRAIAKGPPLTPPKEGLINVAFAVSHGTTWIDFVGPQAVFQTWYPDSKDGKFKKRFEWFLVSETTEPMKNLVADFTFETAPHAHVIVVPAQIGSPALHEWLKHVHTKADVTMSVCTGARHLALAGLLDGQKATTHHGSVDQFAKQFPQVHWVRGMRYVEGPHISTGGGLTAGIDLALRVVERYVNRAEAIRVAEHLEYESRGWIVDPSSNAGQPNE